jgi:hypothetical protein
MAPPCPSTTALIPAPADNVSIGIMGSSISAKVPLHLNAALPSTRVLQDASLSSDEDHDDLAPRTSLASAKDDVFASVHKTDGINFKQCTYVLVVFF